MLDPSYGPQGAWQLFVNYHDHNAYRKVGGVREPFLPQLKRGEVVFDILGPEVVRQNLTVVPSSV